MHSLAPFHAADVPPSPDHHVSRGVWTFTDALFRPVFRRSWAAGAGLESSHGLVRFHPLPDVAALLTLLTLLKGCPDTCIMSGQYRGAAADTDVYPPKDPHGRAGQPKRRAGLARKALHYWRDEPNCLFRVDVDGHPAAGGWDAVLDLLPEALSDAALVVSPSSKAGAPAHLVSDPTALRGHVFALLAEPRTLAEQATWVDAIRASVPSVDVSIYQPSRLLRTAAPDTKGYPDPLAGQRGPTISRGAGADRAALSSTPPGVALVVSRPPTATPTVGLDAWNAKTPGEQERTIADLRAALRAIPADDYHDWIKTLMQLRAGLPPELGFELAEEYSRKSSNFSEDGLDVWDSLNPGQTNYKAVFTRARDEHGWVDPHLLDPSAVGFGKPSAALERLDVTPPTTTPTMPQPKMSDGTTTPFATREDQVKLFAGHCYVLDQHRVLTPKGLLLKPEQFRALFGGLTFLMGGTRNKTTNNAWEAFTENQDVTFPRADSTCFRPEHPFGAIIDDEGVRRVNTYLPPTVRMAEGDAGPLLRHLNTLLPNGDDAAMLLSYLAACVQYPGRKFPWAPVLQGVEGNGKTLFSIATAYAVGRRYTHWPNAQKLNARFNGWMVGKVLYCVEDIYMPGVQGEAILEGMKPMITGGRGIEIEGKNADQVSADICGNFLINTNHKDGVRKTANDRRYGMFYCAQQEAADLARDFGNVETYMRDIYDWLDNRDGLAIFAHYLHTYAIPERFDPTKLAVRAPRTSSHEVAVEAGLGMVEQLVLEAIDEGRVGFKGGWVSSFHLKLLLEAAGRDRMMTPQRRHATLKTLGFLPHPGLPKGRVANPVSTDTGYPILFVRPASAQALMDCGPADIAKAYEKAQV